MHDLSREASEASKMLAGLKVRLVQRHRPSELLIEFDNGTRLFIDAQGALDLSITDGPSS